jgi:8-oxo-dGTP pyrophosphatase MutT (NUDIX family)
MTQPGEKHYTATVFVFTEEQPTRVLMLHHRKFGNWMPPGGHQELFENPLEAAIREVSEETGINIAPYLDKPHKIDHTSVLPPPAWLLECPIAAHGDEPAHTHLDVGYVVRVPHQAVVHQAAESHDIGWFTAEEVAKLDTFTNVRFLLERELAK